MDGVILISSHNRYIENKKSHLEIALFTSYPEPITTKLMFPTYTALDEFLLKVLGSNSFKVPIFFHRLSHEVYGNAFFVSTIVFWLFAWIYDILVIIGGDSSF